MKESVLILERIGQQLARQRKVAGLTQSELASRSKISRATIAAIENGVADPKLTTVMAICAGISSEAWGLLVHDIWVSNVDGTMASDENKSTEIDKAKSPALTHSSLAQAMMMGGGAIACIVSPALIKRLFNDEEDGK